MTIDNASETVRKNNCVPRPKNNIEKIATIYLGELFLFVSLTVYKSDKQCALWGEKKYGTLTSKMQDRYLFHTDNLTRVSSC